MIVLISLGLDCLDSLLHFSEASLRAQEEGQRSLDALSNRVCF